MPSALSPIAVVNASATLPAAAIGAPAASNPDDGFSFDDLLDIVNPLQHIPVVGTLYRAITGDTIKTFPKIAGDTLFGGVTGFLSSVGDKIFEEVTGKNVGDTILGWAEDAFSPSRPTALATNSPPAAPQPASAVAMQGEDLGDRIVDWFENIFSSSPAATSAMSAAAPAPLAPSVATAAPTPLQLPPPANLESIVVPGQDALLMALSRNGVGGDVALRAADAYRRTLSVADTAAANALR